MPGDEYYVDNQKHLIFLEAIKKVRRVETKLKTQPVPRMLPKKAPGPGKYGRKDMTAKNGVGIHRPSKKADTARQPVKEDRQAPGQNANKKKD